MSIHYSSASAVPEFGARRKFELKSCVNVYYSNSIVVVFVSPAPVSFYLGVRIRNSATLVASVPLYRAILRTYGRTGTGTYSSYSLASMYPCTGTAVR